MKEEHEKIRDKLRQALQDLGYPAPDIIPLKTIPFSGAWGWATPVCFILAANAKRAGQAVNEPENAQQIAQKIRAYLSASPEFAKIEAVYGYVNIYFHTSRIANRLIQTVFDQKDDYGRNPSKEERVIIEYSQPNTHKAFHVGHFRNVCLGNALANILDFAGFETISANYPGDIGMHVIKCLWCYLKFHAGEKPPENKGKWLGEIYSEADRLIESANEYRNSVVEFILNLLSRSSIGDWAKQQLIDSFFQKIETGLISSSDDTEFTKNITSFLKHLFVNEPFEINPIAHRSFGDWVWQLWENVGDWLNDLIEQAAEHEGQLPYLKSLISDYEMIGLHKGQWDYAREIRNLLISWEQKDPDFVKLWRETRQWSLHDFHRIYTQLGVKFDIWFYESEVEEEGKAIAEELVAKGVATDLRPNGPVLIEIDKKLGLSRPKYRTITILRSDGTSLYSTKDLSLAKRKFEVHHVDRSIYVVDTSQSLYFEQIFKILEIWGFPQAKNCLHLAYESVRLPSGKMSSREGNVVLFDDFVTEALRRAKNIIDDKRSEESNPKLSALTTEQKELVSHAVAIGAIKYGMLSVDNNKPITFDWQAALSFDGQSAPYIQYAHARSCRILENAGQISAPDIDYTQVQMLPAEINLLELIADFPSVVELAAREHKPSRLASYLYQLAQAFNDFYRDCPVLRADLITRQARLGLVTITKQTIANGLRLLGIAAPEFM